MASVTRAQTAVPQAPQPRSNVHIPKGRAQGAPEFGKLLRFKMRARDPNAPSVPAPTYVTWVVFGVPDFAAAFYTGTKAGPAALVDVVVADTWTS